VRENGGVVKRGWGRAASSSPADAARPGNRPLVCGRESHVQRTWRAVWLESIGDLLRPQEGWRAPKQRQTPPAPPQRCFRHSPSACELTRFELLELTATTLFVRYGGRPSTPTIARPGPTAPARGQPGLGPRGISDIRCGPKSRPLLDHHDRRMQQFLRHLIWGLFRHSFQFPC
jgi:hypothetical protein